MSNQVNTPETTAPASQAQEAAQPKHSLKASDGSGDLYAYLFFLILDAASLRQQTVFIQAKAIESNASAQAADNKLDKSLQFKSIPVGAKTSTINRIQNQNQGIAAQRENIQNCLITLRQQSQVMMTQTSTNVNTLQQDTSMDSGWLSTMQSIYQAINQISQPI